MFDLHLALQILELAQRNKAKRAPLTWYGFLNDSWNWPGQKAMSGSSGTADDRNREREQDTRGTTPHVSHTSCRRVLDIGVFLPSGAPWPWSRLGEVPLGPWRVRVDSEPMSFARARTRARERFTVDLTLWRCYTKKRLLRRAWRHPVVSDQRWRRPVSPRRGCMTTKVESGDHSETSPRLDLVPCSMTQ